jgi:hypothetical protein
MSATVAVSRGPRRNAAHSSGRMARTPNGALFGISAISGLNTTTPKAPATAKIALDSNNGRRSNHRGRSVVHRGAHLRRRARRTLQPVPALREHPAVDGVGKPPEAVVRTLGVQFYTDSVQSMSAGSF